MSTKYLKRFFKPESIAVFGSAQTESDMTATVFNNLRQGGFKGKLAMVGEYQLADTPEKLVSNIAELGWTPDLAVICSDAEKIPSLILDLGQYNVKAALVLTGGLSRMQTSNGGTIKDQLSRAVRESGVRVLGPDCIGILAPSSNINASYTHQNIVKGKVAYIGQSALIGAAMIDWANGQGIGFSHFMTLGDSVDVDLPAVIDYLAKDPYTHSILLQLDHMIGSSRSFMSALRAASRNKLVLVLKSDIVVDESLKTALAPGIPDEERVYDAALRRAGVVRVDTSDQLFHALETLSRMKPMRGERLAIVCNGMGPAALATSRLMNANGQLSVLSDETNEKLAAILPSHWKPQNPVDLNSDATPERFAEAVRILTKDKEVDAVLVIHAPTRFAPSVESAEAVIEVARNTPRNLLTCWMGRSTAIEARNHFNSAGVATFITPEEAVDAFMHMVDYIRNQVAMRQTPANYLDQNSQNHQRARYLVTQAVVSGESQLPHADAIELLDLYDIPVATTAYANDIEGVVNLARDIEGAVAVKALYRENQRPFFYCDKARQRWRDIEMDLHTDDEVRHATTRLAYRTSELQGESALQGFCVQEMKRGFQSLQISVGISRDPIFGPIILFGIGGHTIDMLADRHVMLPPLNVSLSRELVLQSRVAQVIRENSEYPERDIDQLCELLMKLSEMVIDLPNLSGLEINPVLLNKRGILAMDASVSLGEKGSLAISPYPENLTVPVVLKKSGRKAVVRAIRGEDEPDHLEFYKSLSPESIRLRYFYSRGMPTHAELANWTQIDYDREMAFIVSAPKENGEGNETLGVVRAVTDADNISAEFSVVIRDELQGEGLGVLLMQKVIDYCRDRGTLMIEGSTLPNNKGMQGLALKLGFKNSYNVEEDVVDMKMMLHEPSEAWQKKRLEH